ncbi:MAG: outer membrane protein assembly factor BamD, partial [Bacteroidota bacterium]
SDLAAMYFYEVRKDYDKAGFLFEELRNSYRGQARAKDMLYYFADCKYQTGFYVLAAYYFEQYASQYPSDPRTEECVFKVGYCYYLQSAPHYLDQEFTNKTINQFQLFINAYPASDKREEANDLITEMRERLAKKDFEAAKLYYNLGRYKAAVTSLEVFVQRFPDSRYREEAQYLRFESLVYLADNSIANKQKNRYLDAIDYYEKFVDRYPNSVYLKDAENLFAKAKKSLGKLQAEEAENS